MQGDKSDEETSLTTIDKKQKGAMKESKSVEDTSLMTIDKKQKEAITELKSIADIISSQSNFPITVMVVRLFKVTKQGCPGRYNSCDFIAIDEEGDRIHCVIKESLMRTFDHVLEGKTYEMSNYVVAFNTTRFKFVPHKYKIVIYRDIKMDPKPAVSVSRFGFKFFDFNDVSNNSLDKHNFHLDPIEAIVETVYPSLSTVHRSSNYFEERTILAPTHEEVEQINHFVLSLLPGEEIEYLSFDSLCKSDFHPDADTEIYTPDYLNTLRVSGIPHHQLKVKIDVLVMLLRNIDQSAELVNGTRLIITDLGKHVIKGRIISGNNIGHSVLIPRMSLTPTDSGLPFKFTRTQFSVSVCFAMTINKSQGQSLASVGIYLPRVVFTHGQLYVACSRVTSKKGLKILVCDTEGRWSNTTTNVVFKEVFNNI